MSADISAIQASVLAHVRTAVGLTNWNVLDGAPRGYAPPQINVWWTGVTAPAPLEVQDVPHTWNIRIMADSADDPDRQNICAEAWEAIYDEWATSDAIVVGGNAQLAYPSKVDQIEVEQDGLLYVGYDITLTVIVKKARVFTLT